MASSPSIAASASRRRFTPSRARIVLVHEVRKELRYAYVTTGYRADHTWQEALASAFTLHNETWNVWTHLFGFGFFGYLGLTDHVPPAARGLERWPVYVFIVSAMVCLIASAAYHLFGTAMAGHVSVYLSRCACCSRAACARALTNPIIHASHAPSAGGTIQASLPL